MSGICGWVGDASPDLVDAMLSRIGYRGDESATFHDAGVGLGYRFFRERPGKAQGILESEQAVLLAAGAHAGRVALPDALVSTLGDVAAPFSDEAWRELDGSFSFAHYHRPTRTLTIGRDPFGVRSLYYGTHAGTFYFASELKQLAAVACLPWVVDPACIHKYLTFSFVPGEAVPILGIRRLLPGHVLRLRDGMVRTHRYFDLGQTQGDMVSEPREAVRMVRSLAREATKKRLYGIESVALFLSGGLDSSSVGVWLRDAGARTLALSLDFGAHSVESEQARLVAEKLGAPQTWVRVTAESVAEVFDDAVYKLDLPFGDPVTIPQYLLGRAAREAGAHAVFNGEGGDQLFGGWTSKPMVAAAIYGDHSATSEESSEETYLRSYHKFYGSEEALYSDAFRSEVGTPGQRRAHLAPYLARHDLPFLHRVRLADISLKGSQNILPRAERMSHAFGLDLRTPLFDRKLAEASFRLAPELKLHGACEKYVLKLAMQNALPKEIVWRKKFGMSVPVTDLVQSPRLRPLIEDLLGEASLNKRGLFRSEFVRTLLGGQDLPGETRRRRIGERVWTLLMLEAWMRRFVDQRGVP